MDDRIKRITEMETRLNQLTAWLNSRDYDVTEDVRELDIYYHSSLWRSDFEADEAGELPPDLHRGVLSENGIHNALQAYEERMNELFKYEDKLVRVTDDMGRTFTGIASSFPVGYGLHEYSREEEGLQIGEYVIFKSEIMKIEILPTYEEAVQTIPPGRYRHFKGNEYEVLYITRHSETEEPLVVYRALYGDQGIWCRPAAMWNEEIIRDGKTIKRFVKV